MILGVPVLIILLLFVVLAVVALNLGLIDILQHDRAMYRRELKRMLPNDIYDVTKIRFIVHDSNIISRYAS